VFPNCGLSDENHVICGHKYKILIEDKFPIIIFDIAIVDVGKLLFDIND